MFYFFNYCFSLIFLNSIFRFFCLFAMRTYSAYFQLVRVNHSLRCLMKRAFKIRYREVIYQSAFTTEKMAKLYMGGLVGANSSSIQNCTVSSFQCTVSSPINFRSFLTNEYEIMIALQSDICCLGAAWCRQNRAPHHSLQGTY